MTLRDELLNDPSGIGYSSMTDLEAVTALNLANITKTRKSISGSELFGYTDASEYTALSDVQKQQWLALCGIDSVTKSAVPLIKSLFPNSSTTWANIIKTETISRAQELEFPKVKTYHVTEARA